MEALENVSWDIFISHASEDKAGVAMPLAVELRSAGLKVWLDAHELTLGDSLRAKIDEGLSKSRFGVVILSEAFFAKDWPQRELNALVALESKSRKVLLPILHGIDHHQVARYSPILADKLSTSTERGIRHVAMEIVNAVRQPIDPINNNETPRPPSFELTGLKELAGTKVASYQLGEELGSGGSGITFHASHRDLGDELAIKIFYPLAAPYAHFNGLFERGFRALSRLKHPNIVSTKDFGKVDLGGISVFYLVMDYVAGKNLNRWTVAVDGHPEAFENRLQVAQQLAAAMQAAHETIYVDEVGFEVHGILHGDLKPSNIIVTSSGSPTVMDFLLIDVQRLLDPRVIPPRILGQHENEPITAVLGTPGFMAPEQAEQGIVTVTTDIYGLGVTFCHLFLRTSPSPQIAVKRDETLPKVLRQLLIEMTEIDFGRRPQCMAEVVQRLEFRSPISGLRKLVLRPLAWLRKETPKKSRTTP